MQIFKINGGSGGGGGGTVTGTGVAGQVAYWDGVSSITGEAAFLYNAATDTLTVPNLRVTNTSAFGPGGIFGTDRRFDFESTITDFSNGNTYDHYARTFLNPAANVGGGVDSFVAHEYFMETQTAFNFDFANFSVGEFQLLHSGTGDLNLGIAVFGQAYNASTGNVTFEQVAGYFISYNAGDGNISGVAPKAGNFALAAGTGNFGGGTIERDYTIYAESPYLVGIGTISKHWGLFLEDQEFGTESWAIQTRGGKVEFGAVTGKGSLLYMSADDLNQPITTYGPANVYLELTSQAPSAGGALFRAFTSTDAAVFGVEAMDGSAIVGSPVIYFSFSKTDGLTSRTALTGSEVGFVIQNDGADVFVLRGDNLAIFSGTVQSEFGFYTNGLNFTVDETGAMISVSLQLSSFLTVGGQLAQAKGANIVAANDLTPGSDGNTFTVTGNTQINAIVFGGLTAGSSIYLIFTGTPTVKHNTAGGAGTVPVLLAGSVDLVAANNTVLHLLYDGTVFQEVSRKAA